MNQAALEGIRLLDFSHVYQGPVGTQILADYGADVIKVERPGSGDWSRSWGPFTKGVSLPFANLNRNKRSITVDLKSPEGKEMILELVKSADVLVHNFRKGTMTRVRLGYEDIVKINPEIIYASSSGWGDHGPYVDRNRPGHDMMARAEGGWFIFYDKDKPPIPGGVSIDYPSGLNLIIGILIALIGRGKTGQGQLVTTDLLSVAFHSHAWDAASRLNQEKIDRPAAVGGTKAAIYKAFTTADGFIEISPVFSNNVLKDISLAMSLDDLSEQEPFSTEDLQIENSEELNAILAKRFKDKTTDEWLGILEPKGILCARINAFDDVTNDPQIACNNMIVEMEHKDAGKLRLLGNPVRLSKTPSTLRQAPPDLGEHSEAIAKELGYSADEIEKLITKGILGRGSSSELSEQTSS
jgi:crotonobetainyl-CoA:carnitine CoA-transferase CaiB-like acyl-CoA transferase